MIEVNFTRPGTGRERVVFATICVDDDGTVTSAGDMVDELTSVVIPDRGRQGGLLRFSDDPTEWIRNTRKAFRTPYAVPVVREAAREANVT